MFESQPERRCSALDAIRMLHGRCPSHDFLPGYHITWRLVPEQKSTAQLSLKRRLLTFKSKLAALEANLDLILYCFVAQWSTLLHRPLRLELHQADLRPNGVTCVVS